MQLEIESINNIIWNAKKPVLTIKSMAAGRLKLFVGLNFVFNTIRDAIGCVSCDEVKEDIEIARAAIERRCVNLDQRATSKNEMI